jgi:hypothetical protein
MLFDFPYGFTKAICSSDALYISCCSSHTALEKSLSDSPRELREVVEILNQFARSNTNIFI